MKCHPIIKYLSIFILLVSSLLFSFKSNIHADGQGENTINFRWAFVAIIDAEHDQQLVSITRSTVLKTGDRIKMFVEPQKCFVYFIHHNETDEIELLFPYSPQQFDKVHETEKQYFIPMGDEWFEMDKNPGIETFYLIASSSRLSEMEALLAKHERAAEPDRGILAREVLEVIHALKKKHRKIIAEAERPMSIGGSIRGITKNKETGSLNIDLIANQISATDFYSRTFTIDHR